MLSTTRDVPLRVVSKASSSERRITPSWTITQLKGKLESVTGIAPSSQKLLLRVAGQQDQVIQASNEDVVQVGTFPLTDYAEIHVSTLEPNINVPFPTDPSAVPKYSMPSETYSALPDTVLAYKKAHHIGRFDPNASGIQKEKVQRTWEEIEHKRRDFLGANLIMSNFMTIEITVGARCCIDSSSSRHGRIAFVGDVPDIPTPGPWVGIVLDEPTGKNDGSFGSKRYFECKPNFGLFVKPDRVEIGDFPPMGLDEELDSDMEEL